MDPSHFFATCRVVIVAGKGGVGKTTVSAALALAAARQGRSVLVVDLEGKSSLPSAFGVEPFGYEPALLRAADPASGSGPVHGRTIRPDEALVEYLDDHGLRRVSKRLASSGALEVIATAIPGIKDILVLGKVKQLQRTHAEVMIVLDAPAAGHAITFLRAARTLANTVSVGPIHAQAQDVLDLLGDAGRCQVVLVTLAEETPINELIETAYSLEDEVGIKLGPVVVNGVYPPRSHLDEPARAAARRARTTISDHHADVLDQAAAFRLDRMVMQTRQIERLQTELPLPRWEVPYRFSPHIGPADLEELATALLAGRALDGSPGTFGRRQ